MESDLQFVFNGGCSQELQALLDLVVDGVEALFPVVDGVGGVGVSKLPRLELGLCQIFRTDHQRSEAVAGETLKLYSKTTLENFPCEYESALCK